jgi:hypothetical protein
VFGLVVLVEGLGGVWRGSATIAAAGTLGGGALAFGSSVAGVVRGYPFGGPATGSVLRAVTVGGVVVYTALALLELAP